MANNIKGNAPNAVVALTTVSFASVGITGTNTSIIYLVDDPLKSYIPGRSINGITGFEEGKGYYFVAKLDMDLTAYLIPPIPGLTQLATPGSFTATPGDTQNVLDWSDVVSATSYTLDRATNSGFTTGVSLNIYTGSTSGFTDTGLTNGTQYFYRVRATASGFTDSAYATANATPAASGPSFVTWNSIDTDMEQYNTNKGLRKKASASAGWATPSFSNETIIDGQAVVFKLDTIGYMIGGLTLARSGNPGNIASDWTAYFQLIGNVFTVDDGGGATDSGVVATTGLYVKLARSGSNIIISTSPDDTTYTTRATLAGSGTFYIGVQIYGNVTNAGISEIKKV